MRQRWETRRPAKNPPRSGRLYVAPYVSVGKTVARGESAAERRHLRSPSRSGMTPELAGTVPDRLMPDQRPANSEQRTANKRISESSVPHCPVFGRIHRDHRGIALRIA